MPTVATYAGVCLWNWRTMFPDEPVDSLDNLATLSTFTGSLDESWFYLISVAIEARGAPMIPLLLSAIEAARREDAKMVTYALQIVAECVDEVGALLQRMYEQCDPHVFYYKIRPFLAGSENMGDAGLPNGVIFDTGRPETDEYVQYGGGSNAQSSLIQFFDVVLGVEHRPTGEGPSKTPHNPYVTPPSTPPSDGPSAPPPSNNFITKMRQYMPAPHRRFLIDVSAVANIRQFVEANKEDRALVIAYDACLAMLRSMRDKHIQMVSRYIIVPSREKKAASTPGHSQERGRVNLANLTKQKSNDKRDAKGGLRGTGGTALIPFLKQARDETGEPHVDMWARRLLGDMPQTGRRYDKKGAMAGGGNGAHDFAAMGRTGEHADGRSEIVGLAGTWTMDDSEGGICHW